MHVCPSCYNYAGIPIRAQPCNGDKLEKVSIYLKTDSGFIEAVTLLLSNLPRVQVTAAAF